MAAINASPSAPEEFSVHVDFDSTLFDTRRFAHDLWLDIAGHAGLSPEQVQADAAHYRMNPRLGDYDFTAHMTSYGLPPEEMWKRLDKIARGADYLYEDSAPFIQDLRADGYNPRILSFGEKRFQETKIIPALAKLVGTGNVEMEASLPLDFVVVSRRKSEYLAETHPGQRGVLVDDVPDQHLPDGFTEIHLDRSRGLTVPQAKPGGFTVSNLAQARQVIHSLL